MNAATLTHQPQTVGPFREKLLTVLAFLTIYVVWGSTFLAIRIAVEHVPPLFAAGVRFLLAGAILYAYLRLRGAPAPARSEWRNLLVLSVLMFVIDYSALFWAEKYVPSGVSSVLAATIPLLTMAFEVFVLQQQAFRISILLAVLLGFAGVAIITLQGDHQQVPTLPCLVILAGSTSWAIGSVLTRSLRLPESKVLTAGVEMFIGGAVLLILSAATGELRPFPQLTRPAVLALLYLITFGSLLGFTAYMWLLARMPASRVSSYAYINPVIAVALGYFLAGEAITTRTVLGTVLVLLSVALTLRKKAPARQQSQKRDDCVPQADT
jgi:drug/metabolite transporter (DMT)-like permease